MGEWIHILYVINLLISINVIIPAFLSIKSSFNRKKMEINHIVLFSMGFVYYYVLPIFIGINGFLKELPAMDLWHSIFIRIEKESLVIYLCIIFLFYLSFIFGSYCLSKEVVLNSKKTFNFNKGTLKLFLMLGGSLSLVYINRFKNFFFTGYSFGIDNVSEKGPFIALSLVIFVLCIVNASKVKLLKGETTTFKDLFVNRYFIIYIILAFLILSLGGRLYFLSSIFMVITYYSIHYKKFNIYKLMVLFLVMILIMGTIGLLRGGYSQFTLEGVLFNLAQEPLYTSFSLISFIDRSNFEVFNFPIYLLSSVVNMIPTFILPNKLEWIKPITDAGFLIFNPLGALSSFVSFIINFGVLGTSLFLFLLGVFMQKLKNNNKSILSSSMYAMISGFLAFTFFRDGFETSLIKNIFQFAILTPLIVIISAHIITGAVKN